MSAYSKQGLARLCTKLDCVGILVEEGLTVDQAVEALTRFDYELEMENGKVQQRDEARSRRSRGRGEKKK